ncbi:MAG TPA: phospholipase D-like domain-containing protein, partial [Thermoanaerobaculia bacterium]|nr:phospholipase D-like domain-containing protein [Thermoanaerobaculia bacterium]
KITHQGLTLQAIAGTYVVLLGFDMKPADCEGLMGFAVHRTDHVEDEANWMEGLKTFEETDPGLPPGAKYSTRQHPIQGFTWSDFSAKPGHDYTYRVVALKGTPHDLQPFAEASVRVKTESPDGGTHDIYFNRGAAASQEYARRFGNRKPEVVGKAAFDWLSRGLYEAMTGFIALATGPEFELRVCAYEFHYVPVLKALGEAAQRGATVKIIYDRRQDNPGKQNDNAVAEAGITALCTKRTASPSAISHNKFIVLIKEGEAQAVLTGGTNFSEGGIFGHSNAVHIVQEPELAAAYLHYWELLSKDPESAELRPTLSSETQVPDGKPPVGTGAIFSPRKTLDALNFYAALAAGAKDGLFMTFAFGVHPLFQDVYRTSQAGMRYALLEKATRPMKKGPERDAEEAKIRVLRAMPENRFAIGAHFEMNKFDRWLGERLSGLNTNVQYLHTKYLLIDPLGPDPIVVAGSANFSAASTTENDENMLVIRGNKRVAEIYLGEFMRLYNHYAFREWAAQQPADAPTTPSHLRTDRWWEQYFGDTERSRQREYFVS